MGGVTTMKHNYHTHTVRCNHAAGTEREYIERAIEAGMETLGFSDHAPHIAAQNAEQYPSWCMRPDLMEGYVRTVRDLAREYAGQIRVLCGVEIEYTPDFHQENMHFLKQFDLDYMILGQHFLGSVRMPYWARRTDDADLNYYVSSVLSGLATGDFLYLAHPDLLGTQYREEALQREFRRLCEGAKRLGVPLEINLLGIRTGRCYPTQLFFDIAADVGNEVILGADAHSPDELGKQNGEEQALEIAKRAGVRLIERLI